MCFSWKPLPYKAMTAPCALLEDAGWRAEETQRSTCWFLVPSWLPPCAHPWSCASFNSFWQELTNNLGGDTWFSSLKSKFTHPDFWVHVNSSNVDFDCSHVHSTLCFFSVFHGTRQATLHDLPLGFSGLMFILLQMNFTRTRRWFDLSGEEVLGRKKQIT